MVMRRYFDFKIDGGNYRQAGSEQIGFVKCADFRNISSRQHTDTDSYIPRSKIGGSGRPPLAVGSQVDKQRVECRKHDPEAYAHQ